MRALAFSVHILTACGAALALIALIAAARGDWPAMFLALGLALIVDAVDGPLARRLDVAKKFPRWSGETLDLIVDFATYVFVPAYAIAVSGLIPADFAVLVGAVIAIAGALYFADRRMKTPDNYFRGFPGVWNLVAFYLLLLQPAQWIALATVALFVILTFLPIRFVHPFRVAFMRPLTLALLVLWAVLALLAVVDGLRPPWWVTAVLCAIGAYFLTFGCFPQRR
ncbi:MAG TPA: CDP-alcohol phosphatidyltransferase family protein [Xanthobacteraceae bacterium]|nr:CDP-alcohol phosphatidyltransferase family protein [Xanthobacteraceae bacterium]